MNIIEMAKQAGPLITTPFDQWCENFAALVRAEDEALLRQALIGLEVQCYGVRTPAPEALDAIAAIKERLK